MSLIHEALEKLDRGKRERGKNPAPEILTSAPFTPAEGISSEKESARTIYWIGGAVVFLFVLGMVCLLVSSLKSTLPQTDSLSSPPASSSSVPRPYPTPPSTQALFSLTGITQSGTDLTAIINNELVRVGDWVSGAQVKSIQDRKVSLEFRGQEITLRLY